MSKYYLDTEFLEGTQKSRWFRKETKPTIDLISIGIVSEDNREYYAISKDFNLKEAWNRYDIKRRGETKLVDARGEEYDVLYYMKETESVKEWKEQHVGFKTTYVEGEKYKDYWIRENVLKPIWIELSLKKDPKYTKEDMMYVWDKLTNPERYFRMQLLLHLFGKTNKQIAEEIYKFVFPEFNYGGGEKYLGTINKLNNKFVKDYWVKDIYANPQFYGYYSDYDWVVFCWLFGKMIDLPKGFPMYCIDLKQILDEKAASTNPLVFNVGNKSEFKPAFLNKLDWLQNHPNYPKQTNEHNALEDAIFCRDLYKFLNKL